MGKEMDSGEKAAGAVGQVFWGCYFLICGVGLTLYSVYAFLWQRPEPSLEGLWSSGATIDLILLLMPYASPLFALYAFYLVYTTLSRE